MAVRAIRGATQLDEDEREHLLTSVTELIESLLEQNELERGDLISMILTSTPDLRSEFPAVAARELGIGDVPLLCAQELVVVGGTPRCIRVLLHLTTERSRAELRHVYLAGAEGLRDDLPV